MLSFKPNNSPSLEDVPKIYPWIPLSDFCIGFNVLVEYLVGLSAFCIIFIIESCSGVVIAYSIGFLSSIVLSKFCLDRLIEFIASIVGFCNFSASWYNPWSKIFFS